MSVEVSCPVFRCDKISARQCTGHRKPCELSHPGFYDAYQEWQAKVDDITSSYS